MLTHHIPTCLSFLCRASAVLLEHLSESAGANLSHHVLAPFFAERVIQTAKISNTVTSPLVGGETSPCRVPTSHFQIMLRESGALICTVRCVPHSHVLSGRADREPSIPLFSNCCKRRILNATIEKREIGRINPSIIPRQHKTENFENFHT